MVIVSSILPAEKYIIDLFLNGFPSSEVEDSSLLLAQLYGVKAFFAGGARLFMFTVKIVQEEFLQLLFFGFRPRFPSTLMRNKFSRGTCRNENVTCISERKYCNLS